ncbi:MAG: single-stranded-DNA-specific exonuclease RecJ [SAR202 cluster bacterium]|nr:single-stranded-DNA-specific exonuclease RecJ [SAR202 cluster bacterium]
MENEDKTRLFKSKEHPLISKTWMLYQPNLGISEFIADLPNLQATLLSNREVKSKHEAVQFLTSDERLSFDPQLLPNIQEGISLVADTVNKGNTIAIYGDFDVDGISGSAILAETLFHIGASVITYIPDRINEGHSLNEEAIHYLNERNVKLIITVDCGTTAFKEVTLARSLDIDVVVTDHHIANEPMPNGVPVVNPGLSNSEYPFKHLTGAGVALKFCEALCAHFGIGVPSYLYILAAFGTIADLGPLIGENRFIVKHGLDLLKDTSHVGIKALAQRANCNLKTVTARDLSFTLIPRLNASGRLGNAKTSLEILTTTDMGEAESLADNLDQLNTTRRNLSNKAIQRAHELVLDNGLKEHPAVFVYDADWHPGILGLVAGRLSDKYGRPTVAACLDADNIRASIRGPKGYEVLDGLLDTGLDFIKIGGHSQAAGFTLQRTKLDVFKEKFRDAIKKQETASITEDPIRYECEITLSDINPENLKFLKSMEPFGQSNPQPVFLTRGLEVYESRTVGKTNDHIKLIVQHGGKRFDAIGFGLGSKYDQLGSKIDAVYKLNENYWGGNVTIQLQIIDFVSI